MDEHDIRVSPGDGDPPKSGKKLSLETIVEFLKEEGYTGGTFAAVDLPGVGNDDDFNPARRMKEDPDSLCYAHVLEDSLKGLGVLSGDLLCIDKKAVPEIGDLVVTMAEGIKGTVIGRFHHENGRYELRPENPDMETIRTMDEKSLGIWGVVKKVLRSMERNIGSEPGFETEFNENI